MRGGKDRQDGGGKRGKVGGAEMYVKEEGSERWMARARNEMTIANAKLGKVDGPGGAKLIDSKSVLFLLSGFHDQRRDRRV